MSAFAGCETERLADGLLKRPSERMNAVVYPHVVHAQPVHPFREGEGQAVVREAQRPARVPHLLRWGLPSAVAGFVVSVLVRKSVV